MGDYFFLCSFVSRIFVACYTIRDFTIFFFKDIAQKRRKFTKTLLRMPFWDNIFLSNNGRYARIVVFVVDFYIIVGGRNHFSFGFCFVDYGREREKKLVKPNYNQFHEKTMNLKMCAHLFNNMHNVQFFFLDILTFNSNSILLIIFITKL